MRLIDVSKFQVRNPQSQGTQFRIVLFSASQKSPVYVSNSEILTKEPLTSFNEPDFSTSKHAYKFKFKAQIYERANQWKLLKTIDLNLRSLDPVTLPCLPNTLTLVFNNQEYTTPLPPEDPPISKLMNWFSKPPIKQFKSSISYSQLADIYALQSNINECHHKILEIQTEINKNPPKFQQLKIHKQNLEHKIEKVKDLTANLRKLNKQMETDALVKLQYSKYQLTKAQNSAIKPAIPDLEIKNVNYEPEISREQARLAKQLNYVFPIEIHNSHNFEWSICGLSLPQVYEINNYDPVIVGAALGFVAQLVVMISRYLNLRLTYPIHISGSQCVIIDEISIIKHGSNQFPLYTRGALLYRTEYALYLLHKNIEKLMSHLGLHAADLKQTLANLKNVLLVLSSN